MANPWLGRRILDFAHQGGALEGPSSTLYAIESALKAGSNAIELDVHASADGVLVVCHDATVDRTTDGHGAVAQLTLAELKALDNAYYFVPGRDSVRDADGSAYILRGLAPKDERFAIATLDEVLDAFPGVLLNLDIKQGAPEVEAYEQRLAETLRRHGRVDDVIVASFNDHISEAFARFAPEIGTSPGTNALTKFIQAVRGAQLPDPAIKEHVALQLPLRFRGIWLVDERLVITAHEAGLAVHVWTVDDQEDMSALVELGIDGIITNRPSVLAQLLIQRGANYPEQLL